MTIINVGPTRVYKTINSAYGIAYHGDTLLIDEGTYYEKITMVGKIVNLIGNTAYPKEERVKVQAPSTADYFTLWLEWNSAVLSTMYIEGLAMYVPNSTNNTPTAIYIAGDSAARISGLSVVINKCVLRTNIGGGLYPILIWGNGNSTGTYRTASSVVFNNCDMYISTTSKHIFSQNAVLYWPSNARVLNKCKLNIFFGYYISGSAKYDVVPPYLDFIYTSEDYVGYGSKYMTYITPINNTYKFTGITAEGGIPVSRELRIFRSDNDAFITSTTSYGTTGYYEAFVPFKVYYYIICLDAASDADYNVLIRAKCLPIEI